MTKNGPFTRYQRPPRHLGALDHFEPSLAKQEFKAECDINNIMRKYVNTGTWPAPFRSPPVPQYGDFSSAPYFQTAHNLVLEARDQFARMPSGIRDRFSNDPVRMLEFVHDPKNLAEAADLGLLSTRAVEELSKAAAIPAAPPPPGSASVPVPPVK